MADTGGMLTRDRIEAVRQAADRLADMRDALATQQAADAWNAVQNTNVPQTIFNAMNNDHLFGGDEP